MGFFRDSSRAALSTALLASALVARALAQSAAPAPGELADSAIAAIPAVRRAITLGEWRAHHPADTVVLSHSSENPEIDNNSCATLHGDLPLASRARSSRIAYFYVPARHGLELPPPASPDLRNKCILGAIEFLAPFISDSASARSASQLEGARLTGRLTAIAAKKDQEAWEWFVLGRSTTYRYTAFRWLSDSVGVGAADFDTRNNPGRLGDPLFSWYVVVAAPLSRDADMRFLLRQNAPKKTAARTTRDATLDRLLALGGLRGPEADRFVASVNERLHATVIDSMNPWPAEDRRLATVLADFVKPVASRPPDAQIGRLLAADRVAESTPWRFKRWDGEGDTDSLSAVGQKALMTALGSAFAFDHLDDWIYQHSLLARALTLRSDGPAAQQAFLTMMRLGFNTATYCNGYDTVDSVLKHGETYLAAHPSSPIHGEIELMLGEAHADQVALASGSEYSGDDSLAAVFKPIRDSVMSLAAEHFRRGYALLAGRGQRAQQDWYSAWRVSAGIPPGGARFYCISD